MGRLAFVHLGRRDIVAQAVSWARSEQTRFWHPGEEVAPGGREPRYDEEQISQLVVTIETFERRWATWFATNQVVPLEVT
ncbi:MAG: Stf0 family sulfotransferase [Angustibacter sp.]